MQLFECIETSHHSKEVEVYIETLQEICFQLLVRFLTVREIKSWLTARACLTNCVGSLLNPTLFLHSVFYKLARSIVWTQAAPSCDWQDFLWIHFLYPQCINRWSIQGGVNWPINWDKIIWILYDRVFYFALVIKVLHFPFLKVLAFTENTVGNLLYL